MSWYDQEDPFNSAVGESVPETIQTKGKHQRFGASPETEFAPSNSKHNLGFPQRQTSQSRSRNENKSNSISTVFSTSARTTITPGLSLSTNRSLPNTIGTPITKNQGTPVQKPGQLELQQTSASRSSAPRTNSALDRLKPSPPLATNRFKQPLSTPLMPTTSDSSRMNTSQQRTYGKNLQQRQTMAMDSLLSVPQAKQPNSVRAEAVASEFSLRSRNASASRTSPVESISFNKRITRRNSGVAEVIDLLDDDDDEVQVVAAATAEQSASIRAEQVLDADILQRYGALPGMTAPEKRLAFGKLEDRVEVDRIFLGVYGFGSDCQRQLYVRVDSAVGQCLLLGLKEDVDGSVEDDLVRLEEIPFDQIKKIMYCSLDAKQYGHEAIVALSVKVSLNLRSVGVGKDCMLCPTLVRNRVEVDSGRYILLLMPQRSLDTLLAHMRHTPALMKDKASMLGPMFSFQLQDAMLQLEALKCTDLAALRQDWATRAKEELEKKGKVERRRQRSARLQGNEVADPNDSQAYTVYPIEPEVMDAITIFNGDLKRLGPEEYLNDNLIDLKLKHLTRTLLDEQQRARIHAFSCMFYSRLTANRDPELGHGLVARWTKNFDVFDRDFLLIPINYSYHWSLAVVLYPSALLSKLENLQKGNLKELLAQPLSPLLSTRKKKPVSPVVDASGAVDLTEMSTQKISLSPGEAPAGVEAVAKRLYSPEKEQFQQQENASENGQEDQGQVIEEVEQRGCMEQGAATAAAADRNETCILHMDSLGMHGSRTIGKLLQNYLRFEWEHRKKTELSASLAAALEEIIAENSSLEESRLQKQVEARRKRVFENIPVIKCKVPMQANGYDCGLFVTKFAEMLLQRRPPSSAADIDSKFATLLPADAFSQRDVDQERANMRILLETIKAERDALRHRLHEEKRLAAAAASAADPEAAASSSSDSAAEDGAEGVQTGDMELASGNSGDAETTTAVQQADNAAATEGLTEYDIMMALTTDPSVQQSCTAAVDPSLPQSSTAAAEPPHKDSHVPSRIEILAAISDGTSFATQVRKQRKRERREMKDSSSEGSSMKRHKEQGESQPSSVGRVEEDQSSRELLDDHQRDKVFNKFFKSSSVHTAAQDTDSMHNEDDTNKALQGYNIYEYVKHTHQGIAPEATAELEEEDLGEEVVDEAVVEEVVNEVSEGVVDEVTSVDQVLSTLHTSGGSSAKRGAPECGMAEGVSTSKVNYGTARSKLNNTIKQFA